MASAWAFGGYWDKQQRLVVDKDSDGFASLGRLNSYYYDAAFWLEDGPGDSKRWRLIVPEAGGEPPPRLAGACVLPLRGGRRAVVFGGYTTLDAKGVTFLHATPRFSGDTYVVEVRP